MSQGHSLQITICKLISPRFIQNQKIHILLQKQKEKRYSSPCTVKNGTVNFYRQKFQFISSMCQLKLKIFQCENNKLLYCSMIGRNVVEQIYYHPNTFETNQGQFHFFWQAKLLRQCVQKDAQSQEKFENSRDFSISDEFLAYGNIQTDKKKNRRGSIIIKNEDTQSEPGQIFERSQNDYENINSLLKKYSCTYNEIKKQNLNLTERNQKFDKFLLQQIQSEQSLSERKLQVQSTNHTTPQRKIPQKIQHIAGQTKQSEKKQLILINQGQNSRVGKSKTISMMKKPKKRVYSKFDINYIILIGLFSSLLGIIAANL